MAVRDNRAMLAWVGAGVIVTAGVITILIGQFTPMGAASFGWFAYKPLVDASFTSGGSTVVLSLITIAGWVVLTIGLIAFAFLAGRVAGRKTRE